MSFAKQDIHFICYGFFYHKIGYERDFFSANTSSVCFDRRAIARTALVYVQLCTSIVASVKTFPLKKLLKPIKKYY